MPNKYCVPIEFNIDIPTSSSSPRACNTPMLNGLVPFCSSAVRP